MAPKKVAKGKKGARGNNNNNNNAQVDRNIINENVDGNNAGAQGNEGANNNRNNNGAQQNQNQDNNNNNNAGGNNAVVQQNDGDDNANNNGNVQQNGGENNNNNNNNNNDLVLLNAVTAPACMKENGEFKEFFPLHVFAGDANETVEIQVYFASIMSIYTFFKPGVLRFFTLKFMHRQALEAVRAYTRRTPCITHHIANTEVRELTYVCFVFYQLSPEPV